MNKTIKSIAVATIMLLSLIIIIVDIVPRVEAPITVYVDDDNTLGPWDGSSDYPYRTIQEAVDAALPGETVFVLNGTYYEDVYINKTINLTGISRDNTTINSTNLMGIFVENADFVNITGFTVENGSWAGIRLMPSNNSLVENNRVERNSKGIQIVESNNTIVRNNIASNNTTDYGIYLDRSTNVTVKNNTCYGNQGKGIYIFDNSHHNLISGNNCSGNADGIRFSSTSFDNYIFNNTIISNFNYGIGDSSDGGNIYFNNSIKNSWVGIHVGTFTQDVQIYNSTIENSSGYDISVAGSNTYVTTINTTFNKTKSYFGGLPTNLLIVKWYLHINVMDYLGNPVPNAKVEIEDNVNGSYNETFTTDANGYLRWLTVTEYIEQDTDGDTIGEKTFHTPHNIVAWNDTLVGYVKPSMNKSKIVNIVLSNGTFLDFENGWNLISLPRIQSNTDITTVLQSIEGHYDSVWQYNVTDNNDPWKHYHVSKPSYMNDLNKLNHTMGFWIYITDSEGTTLVVFGDELIANQSITLYHGWNLVGFPSTMNRTRDEALNNLKFGTDIYKIRTYNSTTQKWIELDDSMDYLEVGQGYWMHSKVEKVWNVPL